MTDTEKIDLFTIDREKLIEIVSDPTFIKAKYFYVLLALPTIEEKTKGGIILAQESLDNSSVGNNVGRVVSIGKTVGGVTGEYEEAKDLKVGDYVVYNPHAGLPVDHDNRRFLCLAEQGLRVDVPDISKHTDGIFKTYSVRGVHG